MSRPYRRVVRKESFYQRASERREQQEKRNKERLASVGLLAVDTSEQQRRVESRVEGSDNDFGTDARSNSNSSREATRDSHSLGRNHQGEKESGSASKQLWTPRSSLAQPSSTTAAIPRRVCFDGDTDSKRSARSISSPASSISVSQSPVKPSNLTAGGKQQHHRDSQSAASLEDRINKWIKNDDDAQKQEEIDDDMPDCHDSPFPDFHDPPLPDFQDPPHSPNAKKEAPSDDDNDDDDDDDDDYKAYAEKMKAEFKLRHQAELIAAQARALEQTYHPTATDANFNWTNDNHTRDPRHIDDDEEEEEEIVKAAKGTPSVDPSNHLIDAQAVRVVRYRSEKDLFDDSDDQESVAEKSVPVSKEKPKRKKQAKRRDGDTRQHSRVFAQEEQLRISEDRKALELELKPDFSHPKFGPDELLPIVLPGREEGETYSVPASIARYLPTYQRDGIHFLHAAAVLAGTGAILGDDMGLGKTIQIIGLLSALLRKTGTGLDLLELNRRSMLVVKAKEEYISQRDRAFMNGTPLPDENSVVRSLNLPAWAPILLVVPPIVIQNWLNEFKVWGHFAVAVYKGKNRCKQLEEIQTGAAEVLLCATSVFQMESDFACLNKIDWKLVIIDELHGFKNTLAQISHNLRALHGHHPNVRVIGMTGTLMQNQHKELWNLIDLVQPDYLGSWSFFDEKYAKPIRLAMSKTASNEALAVGDLKGELTRLLRPIFLKRNKEIIADMLPKKEEFVVFCELSPLQKRIYQHMMTLPDFDMLKKAHAPCDCGVNQEFFIDYKKLRTTKERVHFQRTNKNKIQLMSRCCYTTPIIRKGNRFGYDIDPRAVLWRFGHDDDQACDHCPYCVLLPALMKLLKVSSHAALLQCDRPLHNYVPGTQAYKSAQKDLEFAKVAIPKEDLVHFPGRSYVREESIMDDHFMLSGKMKKLDELLTRHNAAGKRVLIFSPSTKSLDLIQNYIKAKGYTFLRMDGSVHESKRQPLIQEYQNNPNIFIFILSTRATGVGINLTAANVVIIFDADWNPSCDAQAQDRAYRIGQQNDVQVYRLVSRGTIDELKYIRQIYKEQLKIGTIGNEDETAPRVFRGVQGDKNRKGELFGCENLLKYKDGSFMADFWKANDAQPSKTPAGVAVHSEGAFLNSLRDTKFEEVIGLENDEFQSFELAASRANAGPDDQVAAAAVSDLPEDDNAEELPVDDDALHHGDFFRDDRGGAALKPGDDGYDEEMGGESQMIYEVCEQAGGIDFFGEPEPGALSTQAAVSEPVTSLVQSRCLESESSNGRVENLAPMIAASVPSTPQVASPVRSCPILPVNSPVRSGPIRPKPNVSSEIVATVSASPYPSPISSRNDAIPSSVAQATDNVASESPKKGHRARVLARLQSKRPNSLVQVGFEVSLPAYAKKAKKETKRKK